MKRSPNALSKNPRRIRASAPRGLTARKCLELRDLTECLLEAYECVAHRAFEKFLERGGQPGRELEDWLAAERELLGPITLDIEETREYVHALAAAPCFAGAQVEVSIEPRWLAILAENNSGTAFGETNDASAQKGPAEKQAFCIVQLPAEVVPKESIAILGDGLVGIRMPKAVKAAKTAPVEPLEAFATS